MFLLLTAGLTGQSLYGSGIDAEKALIRLAAFEDVAALDVGDVRFEAASFGEVTPYLPLGPGMLFIEAGDEWVEFIARSGEYYTLVIDGSGAKIFTDVKHDNPVTAQIYLYNLLAEPANLMTADGTIIVIPGLAPGDSTQIAVNPLRIPFALYAGSVREKLAPLPLKRGGSVSLFAVQRGGQVEIITAEASVQTTP